MNWRLKILLGILILVVGAVAIIFILWRNGITPNMLLREVVPEGKSL